MSRIVVIDDQPVMRDGLKKVIELELGLAVCGSGGSVEEGLALMRRLQPDLVLADLSPHGRSGIELIKGLRATDPEIPVLVVSMHDELLYAERVLRAGGKGYVSKEVSMDVLLGAIRRVLGGGIFVSETVARSFFHGIGPRAAPATRVPVQRLTKR
jgi:DNA-binding NarL/FixJ family response regulator